MIQILSIVAILTFVWRYLDLGSEPKETKSRDK